MKDIRQKLLATFQIEHRDHVEQIRSLLALIGKTTGPPAGPEFDEAFRRAHSLKGAARAVDLEAVEGLAHRLETLFSRVRQGALPLDATVAEVVGKALDASEDCVAALGDNRPVSAVGPALAALERVLGIEPAPALAEARKTAPPENPASVPLFQPLDTVRITTRNFDGLLRSSGRLIAETQRQGQVTAQLNALARQIATLEKAAEQALRVAAREFRDPARRDFPRVRASLESLKLRARSLSRQAGAVRRIEQRTAWTMSALGAQLRQDVWQARMVPAESLFEGYRKIMRDLAGDESKEIEFRATAAGIHADRGVLDALKDPLMHALRNAVSHGIETPRERLANGKAAAGLVTLRIDAQGQRLTVAIEDDGRGIDLAKIAQVAVRQGIVSESEAAHSSPRDLARILFRPGFSTAPSITSLAGRGMGLSVVFEAVRRLQGNLDIQPREGPGTALLLSVPLSISTHRLLLVTSAGQPFGVPIHWIERLERIKLSRLGSVEGRPVISFDGQPVPVLRLRHFLGSEPSPANAAPAGSSPAQSARPAPPNQPVPRSRRAPFSASAAEARTAPSSVVRASTSDDDLRIMVLRSNGTRVAVAVDAFLKETEAVIQDLGPAAPPDGRISGGFLLDDGAVAFVLNPLELLEGSWRRQERTPVLPAEPQPKLEPPSILVVDDSMTTRTLEKSILEAHGYRVRVAVDGVEALALLRAAPSDLVISDIQMPRMDGFELLEAIKMDPRLSAIPVIVVTSLDRREDRERGLALGAGAYIVKRKFDQGELLAAIRQILR